MPVRSGQFESVRSHRADWGGNDVRDGLLCGIARPYAVPSARTCEFALQFGSPPPCVTVHITSIARKFS